MVRVGGGCGVVVLVVVIVFLVLLVWLDLLVVLVLLVVLLVLVLFVLLLLLQLLMVLLLLCVVVCVLCVICVVVCIVCHVELCRTAASMQGRIANPSGFQYISTIFRPHRPQIKFLFQRSSGSSRTWSFSSFELHGSRWGNPIEEVWRFGC